MSNFVKFVKAINKDTQKEYLNVITNDDKSYNLFVPNHTTEETIAFIKETGMREALDLVTLTEGQFGWQATINPKYTVEELVF